MISHDIQLFTGGGRWKPWKNGAKTSRRLISRIGKIIPNKMVRLGFKSAFMSSHKYVYLSDSM